MVISEIMYRPAVPELAFVELFNSSPLTKDLSGWRLDGAITYAFPSGTIVTGRSFVVVAMDPMALSAAHDLTAEVLGPYEGTLNRNSGSLRLYNRLGGLALEAEYSARYPWPAAPAGGGHSLVLARPSYGEGTREAWAASALKGGSPGAHEPVVSDPLDAVVINEFLAHTDDPVLDFVELFNTGTLSVDLSGAWLSDKAETNRFRIPDGTILPPGGFIAYDETELGFAFAASGEAVFLVNPDDTRVIDAIHYDAQANGISMGRYPDGAPEYRLLATPTPAAPNTDPYISPVVINEIMFNPISGDAADTYIELYNRSDTAVDLSDWRLVDGISFAIPYGTILPAGAYLIIARDRERLMARYPQLHEGNTVGNFGGRLAFSGERLALAIPSIRSSSPPDYVTVHELHYRDGGRWGRWANRDGSSLELRDPRSDNRFGANWTHSDESAKSEWVLIEHTGVLDHGRDPANQLHIILPASGDVLIDNVEVRIGDGPNLVANSTFESGMAGWEGFGHHGATHWHGTEGFESAASLRVQASGGGDTGGNRVRTALTETLQAGQTVTIRARARWLAGHTQVLLRLKGNYLEVMGDLHIPEDLGTPGLPNSALQANIGPAIYDVRQAPVLPAAGEPVTVTARVDDPDGITDVTLHYRIDPSPTYTAVPMIYDAGFYHADIPGQAADTLVAFHIAATDGHSTPATATYPDDPSVYEALIRFGMAHEPGVLKTYQLWFTQAVMDEWNSRPALSNQRLPGTLVYGDRVIHGIMARYRGSPWRRPSDPSGYSFQTPRDNRLLGVREFNLNATHENDSTGQREFLGYWIADQIGVQTPHTTFVHVRINGVPSTLMSGIFTDVHHINSDYVEKWFPDDDLGEMFKADDWFEFRDNFTFKFNVNARLERYTTTGGAYKQARYRWNWNKRSNRGLDDDYSRFFHLIDAVNEPDYYAYERAVRSIVDIEQWMRVFAARRVVGEWDGYGFQRGKDAWLYKATSAPWRMLLWDLDKGLGAASSSTAHLFGNTEDPTADRMYWQPSFGRAYLQAVHAALHGPMQASRIDPVMDEVRAALQDNGIDAAATGGIKSWLNARRTYLAGALADYESPFELDPWVEGGDRYSHLFHLYGYAPLSVATITVNGVHYPVTWWDVPAWYMSVPLVPGANSLHIQAWAADGELLDELTLEVNFLGSPPDPTGQLVINEILYDPQIPETEFVEIHNRSAHATFDLTGYRLRGVDFDFPAGTLIEPGGYWLVVRDRYALLDAYGPGLPIIGEYNGTLQPGGEQLRLVRLATDTEPELLLDEINYSAFSPWPDGARGTGSSIQRMNPAQPGDDPANWYAVTEATPLDYDWQHVQVVGRVLHNRIYIYLEDAGEVHLDDLSLKEGSFWTWGPDFIVNGNFALPLEGTWTVSSNLAGSQIVNDVFRSAGASLHVVATSAGSSQSTAIWQDRHGEDPTSEWSIYTLSYWYLPNTNGAPLTVRYRFSGGDSDIIAHTHDTTPQPRARATPGARNSVPIGPREITQFPPVLTGSIPLQRAIEQGEPVVLDLNEWFTDPDNDPLVFTAAADPAGTAHLTITNGNLRLDPLQRGDAVITVSADDGDHPPVSTPFRLLVYPAPHRLATGPYSFTSWDADLPERVYPPHMLFLQTDQSDTALDSPLDFAYYIPHDQYHANDQGTIGFPYNNTGRSRITGLGEDGIAFINTGQNRDLGGAVLALDTRWLDSGSVDWLAGTVTPNSRVYAIRLQYRVGIDGPFVDWLDDQTNVIEYVRNDLAGHAQSMPAASLPTEALDAPYVQVLWRYHRVSGSSGPRAELRLDDIRVEGAPAATVNTGTPHWWLDGQGLEPPYESAATNLIGLLNRPAWQYYLADLDPHDPDTQWPQLLLHGEGGIFRLVWDQTSVNRSYRIWAVDDLVNGIWHPVTNLPGTGTLQEIDIQPAARFQLYRGDIVLPATDAGLADP